MEIEQPTEIFFKQILPGNVENVRFRIADALETIGYDILEDDTNIVGRRRIKGSGISSSMLEIPTTLNIRVKSVGENSTRATFDYSIKAPLVTTGEKRVLSQETKTIAAIAKSQAIEKCFVCETPTTDDSKFCRKCGAPLTSEQSELEISKLRMMAETAAGKGLLFASSIALVLSSVFTIVMYILNNAGMVKAKLFPLLMVLGGLSFLFGTIASLFGLNRLKRALDIPENNESANQQPVLESKSEVRELPPKKVGASVTEGTTNLLNDEWTRRPEKEKVPISVKAETKNFD